MKTIATMYITLMALIFAEIANHFFCKSDLLAWANEPIDGGLKMSDGRRFLGANRTWKRFWGMIAWTAFFQIVWGLVLKLIPPLLSLSLVVSYHNDFYFNLFFGFMLGAAYALFELPTSFFKRRFNIPSGQEGQGKAKWFFILLEQLDSFIGCVAVLALFSPMSFSYYLGYVLLGGLTTLAITYLLLLVEAKRKSPRH